MHSNSSISFIYKGPSTQEVPKAGHLIVKYKGEAIAEQYSFVTKIVEPKELNRINSNESLHFTSKYIWIKATHDPAGPKATWIKIQKNELISKLGIKEEELSSIHKANELQALMNTKVKQALKRDHDDKLVGSDKLITTLIKSILCFFAVAPTAKDKIREQISKIDQTVLSNGLEELYISGSKDLLDNVKKNLLEENPKALLFFGDEKISEIIDEVLIEEVAKKLKNDKKPAWNESKIKNLNVLRDLDAFEKNNPDGINEYTKLDQMNAKDIPIAKLAKIPLTDLNKMKLSEIFNKVLLELHTEGKLGELMITKDERSLILQLEYAVKFLEAYALLPSEIRNELNKPEWRDLGKMEASGGIVKITDFTIQNAPLMMEVSSSVGLKIGDLEAEQQIYKKKIYPKIFAIIEDNKKGNAVPNLIKIYLGMNDNGRQSYSKTLYLTSEERQNFSENRIHDLLCKEIERTLIVDYDLTSTQLNNIRESRKKNLEEINRFLAFKDNLEQCKSPSEIFNLLYFSDATKNQVAREATFRIPINLPQIEMGREIPFLDRLQFSNDYSILGEALKKVKAQIKIEGNQDPELSKIKEQLEQDYEKFRNFSLLIDKNSDAYELGNKKYKRTPSEISQLLIDQDVRQEISAGQSSPLLTPTQQIGLMEFERFFNNQKLKKIEIKQEEFNKVQIEKAFQFLEDLKKDPHSLPLLESFKEKEVDMRIQSLLDNIPQFLQGLVKRAFSINPESKVVNKIPAGISKDTIDFLLEYVKRSPRMEKIEETLISTVSKAEELLKKFENDPTSVKREDRLNLQDLGLLEFSGILIKSRFSKDIHFNFLKELKNLGLEEVNSSIKNFGEQAVKAQAILNKLEKILPPERDMHYAPGDILAHNLKKMEKWKGGPLDPMLRIVAFFSNGLRHAAKLYRDADNKIGVSEMESNIETNILNLKYLSQSDIWRLDLAPLVPTASANVLKKIYGQEWQKEIDKLYRQIENRIHLNEKKLSKLENSNERKLRAGTANYSTLISLLTGEKVQGHQNDYEEDVTAIHKKFFKNDKAIKGEMICSEFVSEVTIAAFIELNMQLSKEIFKHFKKKRHLYDNPQILENLTKQKITVSDEVDDYAEGIRHFGKDADITKRAEKEWRKILKERTELNEEEIELTIRLGNKEILDLPYSKKERMEAIHPGRMVQLLVEKGCAVKIGLSPNLALLLDVDEEGK